MHSGYYIVIVCLHNFSDMMQAVIVMTQLNLVKQRFLIQKF